MMYYYLKVEGHCKQEPQWYKMRAIKYPIGNYFKYAKELGILEEVE